MKKILNWILLNYTPNRLFVNITQRQKYGHTEG